MTRIHLTSGRMILVKAKVREIINDIRGLGPDWLFLYDDEDKLIHSIHKEHIIAIETEENMEQP